MTCKCHSDPIYMGLTVCPGCGHKSYDPGVGCERRRCGYVEPAFEAQGGKV